MVNINWQKATKKTHISFIYVKGTMQDIRSCASVVPDTLQVKYATGLAEITNGFWGILYKLGLWNNQKIEASTGDWDVVWQSGSCTLRIPSRSWFGRWILLKGRHGLDISSFPWRDGTGRDGSSCCTSGTLRFNLPNIKGKFNSPESTLQPVLF